MLKSACRLAGGAKPVSWLLFSDGPMTVPSPVAIGEGPHRMQHATFCMETACLPWSLHTLCYSII